MSCSVLIMWKIFKTTFLHVVKKMTVMVIIIIIMVMMSVDKTMRDNNMYQLGWALGICIRIHSLYALLHCHATITILSLALSRLDFLLEKRGDHEEN